MNNWATAPLKELLAFVIGGVWGKPPDHEDPKYIDVLCIRGTELRDWHSTRGASATHRKIKASSLEKRKLKAGDLILEVSGGGPEQPVGRVELIDKQAMGHHAGVPRVCTNFFRRLEVVQGIEPAYLARFLKYFYTTGEIRKYQAGSNNLRNLKYPEYEQIEIPIPPLNEQRRIVEKLETLFAQLEKGEEALREVQKLLARYRQSVLKAAVTGQLTEDWRADNSAAKWYSAEVGDLVEFLTSGSRGWAKYYSSSGPLFIRAQNLKHDRLDLDNAAHVSPPKKTEGTRTLVKRGDILITITGANVTRTALVVAELGEAYVSQHVGLLRLTGETDPEFIYWFFVANAGGRKQLEKFAYGAGKPGLSLTNIREVKLALPSLPEQKEIVLRVQEESARISMLEDLCRAELARCAALRQSILKDAFMGRLVPQDPADEPAADLLSRIRETCSGALGQKGRKPQRKTRQ